MNNPVSRLPISLSGAVVAGLLLLAPASTNGVELSAGAIAGGGGTSTGAGFSLTATIGQPAAAAILKGGRSIIEPGLWTAVPERLLNISTRMEVFNGDNILIAGFIVTGTDSKKVLIRAIGPSLGINGALANPTLELHGPSGVIATNDNWKINDQTGQSQEAAIAATTIPPKNDLESALVVTLPANSTNYTAVVRGKNDGTGLGLVEIYDLGSTANSELANISIRGFVDTGDNLMIGGLIAGPTPGGSTRVVVRALGPSLFLTGALQDPTLELHNGSGTLVAANDNWKINPQTGQSQESTIKATGVAPSNDLESALLQVVGPGNYTAIVRGKNNGTGIGLLEVYNIH